MRPLVPCETANLFGPLHAELLRLLRGLDAADWERPTLAGLWRVRDVAAHLLDGDLRALSALRDGHLLAPEAPLEGYRDLVGFLDRLNAEWISASQRLSPRVLMDLLAATGPEVAAVFASMPPHEPAPFPVDWAGEAASENWMHVGREYTERWHHQAQIRDAVGAHDLFDARWLHPLLDVSLRALPHAYRHVEAPPEATVTVEVDGAGTWTLLREAGTWTLYAGAPEASGARIWLDADAAWKTLYNAITPAEARARARVEGDDVLVAPFFRTRSVMVAPTPSGT